MKVTLKIQVEPIHTVILGRPDFLTSLKESRYINVETAQDLIPKESIPQRVEDVILGGCPIGSYLTGDQYHLGSAVAAFEVRDRLSWARLMKKY